MCLTVFIKGESANGWKHKLNVVLVLHETYQLVVLGVCARKMNTELVLASMCCHVVERQCFLKPKENKSLHSKYFGYA